MALAFNVTEQGSIELTGTFADLSWPQLLLWLFHEKQQGQLVLQTQEHKYEIYFSKGYPVGLRGGSSEYYLGQILLERSLISDQVYMESLQLMAEKRDLHGQILLQMGAIQQEQLSEGLEIQLRRKLVRLFREERAQFRFLGQPKAAVMDVAAERLDPRSLIYYGVRQYYPLKRLRVLLNDLQPMTIQLKPAPFVLEKLPLEEDEKLALRLLQQWTTIQKLVKQGYLEELPMMVLLGVLHLTDLLDSKALPKRAQRPGLPPREPTKPTPTAPSPKDSAYISNSQELQRHFGDEKGTTEDEAAKKNEESSQRLMQRRVMTGGERQRSSYASVRPATPKDKNEGTPPKATVGGSFTRSGHSTRPQAVPQNFTKTRTSTSQSGLSARGSRLSRDTSEQKSDSLGPSSQGSERRRKAFERMASSSQTSGPVIAMGPPPTNDRDKEKSGPPLMMGPPPSQTDRDKEKSGPPLIMGPPPSSSDKEERQTPRKTKPSSRPSTSSRSPERRSHSSASLGRTHSSASLTRASSGSHSTPDVLEDLTPEQQAKKKEIQIMAKSLKDTNHYDLLGIQRSATDQAIQRSYYKLSRAFHPDSVAGTPLQQMRKELDIIFAKISEANTVLTNPTKREEYDQLLDNPDLAQLNDQAQQAAQAEVFYTKGNVYLKTRNYQAAEEQLKWACDLLPNEGEYHLDYAWAIFKNPDNDPKESIEKANKHLKIAMEKGANYIKSLYYKGSIEKAENTPKLALKTFEELLKRQPHHTEAAREARYLKIQLNKAKGKSNKKSGLLGGLFKK